MESLKLKLKELQANSKEIKLVDAEQLKEYGLTSATLRSYQLYGVNWILQRYNHKHGCILGDEMGLGKTIQTIASLLYIENTQLVHKPYLIVCPLTVMGNWQDELSRFSPKLKVVSYHGDKAKREQMQTEILNMKTTSTQMWNVVLTTYEIAMKDEQCLNRVEWGVLVVDEAHRLKNSESLLHVTLSELHTHFTMLLTGTPVQNNLEELYSLLRFVAPSIFRKKYRSDFVAEYQLKLTNEADMSELHDTLKPFLLRRVKTDVLTDLPQRSDLVFYHGISDLQKKYYKAILLKDIDVFEKTEGGTSKASLMNIMMQLRKCVNHPYLFDGVEPEPFMLGEHLVEASGKLTLIDDLLSHLYTTGHKVLLFSQMTHMLDILQDYLGYRGYNYERLDGSVRGEERFVAVRNFNRNDDTFVFLLSSKAGGQGLNLTSADTVIFVDSDFNPQNDLQAAARAHRIGQTRPVKVIRLIGKSTVEEIILRRAEEKLRMTTSVIEGGQLAGDRSSLVASNSRELQEILKFGLSELMDDQVREKIDYISMLGPTVNGQWQVDEGEPVSASASDAGTGGDAGRSDTQVPESMYVFEGTDYSNVADTNAFHNMMAEHREEMEQNLDDGRSSRRLGQLSALSGLLPVGNRPRKKLTPEQIEERTKKRAETLARKKKEVELEEIAKEERREKRKQELWKRQGYVSCNITVDSEGDESEGGESEGGDSEGRDVDEGGDDEREDVREITYVSGDVTQPRVEGTARVIIVHCVDDSGSWGHGGVFSALDQRSPQPKAYYETASHMKDLSLGDVHLIPLDDGSCSTQHLALVIAQHRDRNGALSGIKLSALAQGLQAIRKAAKQQKASVHLPRIGYNTPGFNWYGTERLICKHLTSHALPTYIYYFPRKNTKRARDESGSFMKPKVTKKDTSEEVASTSPNTLCSFPNVFRGMNFYLHCVPSDIVEQYQRFIVAYDGDVDDDVTDCTTHVVTLSPTTTQERQNLTKVIGGHSHVSVVSNDWLERCIRMATIVPVTKYEINMC